MALKEKDTRLRDAKYFRSQDYVIKDGKLVGEFEAMYRDFDDPWEQTTREEWASEKAAVLNIVQKLHAKKVLELGCGLGHYTNKIAALGVDAMGVDISTTAVEKARATYPACEFVTGDILDFDIYRTFQPDVIIMAEISWYVLDKLDDFIRFMKSEMPDTYLIHLLTTYPEGVQKYGKDRFTNLSEIMSYFAAQYIEWGEIFYPEMNGCRRTYYVGHYKGTDNTPGATEA